MNVTTAGQQDRSKEDDRKTRTEISACGNYRVVNARGVFYIAVGFKLSGSVIADDVEITTIRLNGRFIKVQILIALVT